MSAMIFIDNKYTRIYYSIISNAQNRILPKDTYTEQHHIIPSSLGGSNDKTNLVKLTAREHFICHWLLTKMTTDKCQQKMIHAVAMMNTANSKQLRYRSNITSKIYEKYKILSSLIKKKEYKGRIRNNTKYKWCHVDGKVEYCAILELSQKYNIPRYSLAHLIKKPFGKHHVKGWAINNPMLSASRSVLYQGEGSPTYDSTLYTFYHTSGITETCTKYELFTKYNLSRNGIYALCSGLQKTSQGWAI